MLETMSAEIQDLILRLRDTVGAIAEHLAQHDHASSADHMLSRHRQVLDDQSREFSKTKTTLRLTKERAELLPTVQRDITSYMTSQELYLKENQHTANSSRMADDAISIAMSTKEALHQQRNSMLGISSRMTALINRFPVIGSIAQKINFKKRKDSLILAAVISVCILTLLLYTFR